MTKGKISHWNYVKMFGFVEAEETGESFFFHLNNFRYRDDIKIESIQKGLRVEFEVRKSKKKPGSLEAKDINFIGHDE